MRAPGPVSFAKGTLSGTSVGMTYDEPQRHPLAAGAGGREGGAGQGHGRRRRHHRRNGRATRGATSTCASSRGVRLVREGRTVEADAATAFLSDDGEPAAADGIARARAHHDRRRGGRRARNDGGARHGPGVCGGRRDAGARGPEGRRHDRHGGRGWAPHRRRDHRYRIRRRWRRDGVDGTRPGAAHHAGAEGHARADHPCGSRCRAAGPPGQGPDVRSVHRRRRSSARHRPAARCGWRAPRTLDVAMAAGTGAIEDARFAGSTRFEEGTLRASAARRPVSRHRRAARAHRLGRQPGPARAGRADHGRRQAHRPDASRAR